MWKFDEERQNTVVASNVVVATPLFNNILDFLE